jgi:hypothetical protein
MLSIYRRHTKAFIAKRPQHDRSSWKCQCVIYAEGSLGGEYIRQSLKTSSREQANRRIQETEARRSWDAKPKPANRNRTITDAIAAFLEDAASTKGGEFSLTVHLNADRCARATLWSYTEGPESQHAAANLRS